MIKYAAQSILIGFYKNSKFDKTFILFVFEVLLIDSVKSVSDY